MKALRVGLAGCGHNSENHLRVYSNTQGVRLVAVCDRKLSKARLQAEKYGAGEAFNDYASMLRLDLDLVDVVTPTPTHAELSIRALEAGHNVLVEKPMALTSKECLAMIRATRKSGRSLCVVHNKLFFDSIVQAKTMVEEGAIRPSRMWVAHHFAYRHLMGRWRVKQKFGGLLWDTTVHPIYLTEHLLGPIESVYALVRRVTEHEYDSFTLVLQNQGVSLVEFIWNAKQPLLQLKLIGQEGECLSADLVHDILTKSLQSMSKTSYALKLMTEDLDVYARKCLTYLKHFYEIGSYPGGLPYQRTFFPLIRKYISFLNGQTNSPPVKIEDGLRSITVLEAAQKSIESGRPHVVG